jgi:hypothetical protein
VAKLNKKSIDKKIKCQVFLKALQYCTGKMSFFLTILPIFARSSVKMLACVTPRSIMGTIEYELLSFKLIVCCGF